ncbi:class I SAM-dependent methyltransferase [Cupriavidus sp. CP313]
MTASSIQSLCVVCSSLTQPGIARWHFVCPACGYEGSWLEPVINDPTAHLALDEGLREAGLKALRMENFREIVKLILDLTKSGRPLLLDVGAAHGWFLDVAQAHFRSLGIEPDIAVVEKAVARGVPVRAGYFPDALEQHEAFDVIVFNDVIEHLPAIGDALAACAARLNSDGLLVLNLPNSNGLFYRLSRVLARVGWQGPFARLWQKDLPSPHVHYFNRENLNGLLSRFGFSLVRDAELPSVRLKGLAARLRCADPSLVRFVVLYLGTLAVFPLTRMFPSDAIVCVYRKGA